MRKVPEKASVAVSMKATGKTASIPRRNIFRIHRSGSGSARSFREK
jgi:hypothetical protein